VILFFYRHRKGFIIVESFWIIFGNIVTLVVSILELYQLQPIAIACEISNNLFLVIMFIYFGKRLRDLISQVENEEKSRSFSKKLMILAIIFVGCLILGVGWDLAFIHYQDFSIIPPVFTWIFRYIQEMITVVTLLWLLNPLRFVSGKTHSSSPTSSAFAAKSSSSAGESTSGNNAGTTPTNSTNSTYSTNSVDFPDGSNDFNDQVSVEPVELVLV